jgi:hypothetical protein
MTDFYPGAGYDFSPVVLFPNTKEWIFMDSLPNAKFNSYRANHFINRLMTVAKQFSLELVETKYNKLIFTNKSVTVTYYINSIFPNDLEKLNIKYSTLYLCGFGPDEGWDVGFLNKFNHIITQKHNLNDINIKNTNIKISYVEINPEFKYWLDDNRIPENISKNYKITLLFIKE